MLMMEPSHQIYNLKLIMPENRATVPSQQENEKSR
jgi:hypothetical protein